MIIGIHLYNRKIASSFKQICVKDLNIKYGTSIPGSKRISGKYELYGSNGIIDNINQSNAENAIVFGCRGTLGNVYFSKKKCFVLNTAFYFEEPENFGNLFFALVVNKGLTLYASGAAQPQITINSIINVNLKVPTDSELNELLNYVSLIQQKLVSLKTIKKILLQKYFG